MSPGMESNIHTKAQRCASASSGKAQWWGGGGEGVSSATGTSG